MSVYDRLGVRPVINGAGTYTDLGGSLLSPDVWQNIAQLNEFYVDIPDLLARTGAMIAELVGSESARVTPGASSGTALAIAACMARHDPRLWQQLPDTTGMPHKVIVQHNHAKPYKYIHAARLPGAQIVLAGSDAGTSRQDLDEAIDGETAAVLVPVHLDGTGNVLDFRGVIEIARARDVPVVVDAAYQVFPPVSMRRFAEAGADLTCISAKYFAGPNAGGFVSGSRYFIDAIAGLDFTKYEAGEFRTFGRPFKMGRFDIAAVALALQEWFEGDHDVRLAQEAGRAAKLLELVEKRSDLSGELKCFTLDERLTEEPVNSVVLTLTAQASLTPEALVASLAAETPSIRTVLMDDRIVIVTETLREGQESYVAERIHSVLGV
jgi:L-seryl-tRNA(Ser) seleniumtransferase